MVTCNFNPRVPGGQITRVTPKMAQTGFLKALRIMQEKDIISSPKTALARVRKLKIVLASDHAGYHLKTKIKGILEGIGIKVVKEVGCYRKPTHRVDFPIYAALAVDKIMSKEADRAILVCGSSVGMEFSSNKVIGIRTVSEDNPYKIVLGRSHTDVNVLGCGEWLYEDEDKLFLTLALFLATPFKTKKRYVARIRQTNALAVLAVKAREREVKSIFDLGEDLTEEVKKEPSLAKIWLARGDIYLEEGKLGKALEDYRKYIRYGVGSWDFKEIARALYAKLSAYSEGSNARELLGEISLVIFKTPKSRGV